MSGFLRFFAGIAFWTALLGLSWHFLSHNGEAAAASKRLIDHLQNEPQVFAATFPLSAPLEAGNPVRVRVKNGFFAAGVVRSVANTETAQLAQIAIFPEYTPLMGAGTKLVAARTSGDVGWVVRTLLPKKTQGELRKIIEERWGREKDKLFRDLSPGIVRLMEDALALVQEELPDVTHTNKHDFDVIGVVLKEKGWENHIEDIFSAVLWPLIQERSEPMLNDMGDEIVDAFPVWSMSWAYLAESIPFTDKDRFEKKVRKFIKKKAIPILAKRQSALKSMAAGALKDTLKEERTVEALQKAGEEITADPRFRAAATNIAKALFLENPKFQILVKSILARDDLRQPVDRFIESFEPAIRSAANRLLMNERRDGINPDLARVLRRKLLKEDEDWVLLDLEDGSTGEIPATLPGSDGGRR